MRNAGQETVRALQGTADGCMQGISGLEFSLINPGVNKEGPQTPGDSPNNRLVSTGMTDEQLQ